MNGSALEESFSLDRSLKPSRMQTCHFRHQMVSETSLIKTEKSDHLIIAALLLVPEVEAVSLRSLVHLNSCGSKNKQTTKPHEYSEVRPASSDGLVRSFACSAAAVF